ncbi:pilus assembly protein TadG-related protein [Actinomyces sp.]|uniref:pilus assembly protein TadG-related protein n=1 Tax=Actinomyces sp. TaxID=29317 RepID=UPI0034C6A1C8
MRRRLGARRALNEAADEQGSILPYTVAAAFVIVLVAVGLMTGLGSVILERRNASTAADAAALAAAEAWAESLESVYDSATGAGSAAELWDGFGSPIGPFAGHIARQEAVKYAALNEATVTSYRVNATAGTVTVSVRSNSPVTGTDEYMTASATAELVFEEGLCLRTGRIGLRINGACRLSPPSSGPSDSGPSDTDLTDPAPGPTPFRLPSGMEDMASIDTRLRR